MNDKKEHLDIHRMPKGIQGVHKKYGLWILNANKSYKSNVRFSNQYRSFEFYSLSHMYSGKGMFYLPGIPIQKISAGQAILIPPGFIHWYGAQKGAYFIEDTVCFTGIVANMLLESGIISPGIIEIGSTRRLLKTIALAEDPAFNSQINANFSLQKLFLDLYNEKKISESKDNGIKKLIKIIKEDKHKWWTVSEMAEISNLSTAQFRRIFKLETGLLPKKYIEQLKMKQVIADLIKVEFPIAKIALSYGYTDPFHFSRRFKKIIGVSPSHYRSEFLKNKIGSKYV